MKITPLDIQQQQFRVRFRGFDMVEVDNFLDLLANEFEELLKENSQLRDEERRKMARINELEAEEKELRNALVSVQRITEEMKNNARKEGELIIEEAKGNARKIVDSAHAQTLQVEAEINQLQRQRAQLEASLKATIEMHLQLLETFKKDSGDSDRASPASPRS
ncbi:MAG: DivIVA domain-containing protein [Thermodesulfobacteriota bacterium]|nr:DivIVA domain-containing protein [Thermodesulfobacteriota bacterium]